MITESARMNSVAEARFRVQAPNSLPRAITVIGLDAAGRGVVERLAGADWRHATFLAVESADTLVDLSGRPLSVDSAVERADLVVLIAGPGGRADAAPVIGDACSRRRVMTTGLVVGANAASEREVSKTLAQLRPWSLMVVIAGSDDYVDDMMAALRA